MALLITSNDITYKNIVGFAPSVYVILNPDLDGYEEEGKTKVSTKVFSYKDKGTANDNVLKRTMKLDVSLISPFIELEYLTDESAAEKESSIHEQLKSILIERNPNWENSIDVVDLKYQEV